MQAPRLRAGLIGTGFIGPVHAEALARLGIELTAVCGSARGVGALASRFAVKETYADHDYSALIASKAVDVVHITSPNRFHYEQAMAVLAAAATSHLKKVIVAARTLGLDLVNTFLGADHRLCSEANFERFTQVWPDLIRFAEDQGVRIGIENCPMLFTLDEWPAGKNLASSPAIWRRMFEVIPSPSFGLNYDPSHLVWQMMDYLRPLREFKDRLFHVHAKDLKINREQLDDVGILALGWSTPKIPGFGEVSWGQFFSELTDAGYTGPVCVEVEDAAFGKTLAGRQRALRVSRQVLEPFFSL